MLVLNGYKEDYPKYLTSSNLSAIIIKQMKHMIKWLKITAGINLYLSVVMTFVFLTLLFAIVTDYNLTNADEYVRFLIKEELHNAEQSK
jgi:hypothetical protein